MRGDTVNNREYMKVTNEFIEWCLENKYSTESITEEMIEDFLWVFERRSDLDYDMCVDALVKYVSFLGLEFDCLKNIKKENENRVT